MNHTVCDTVVRADSNGITTLTLNRPDQFNALSEALLKQLDQMLAEIGKDDTVRVVIIKANGRAYCVGHDLKEMRENTDAVYLNSLFSKAGEVMLRIKDLPQPVIASVHAVAAAGGCQLVAACDLAVASDKAKFAVSGINLGLFCSTPAVALSRNISQKRAMEMLLTGDFIDAETALDYGLVNQVVPTDSLGEATMTLAEKIASKPPAAVRMGKALFYQQLNQRLDAAYQQASETITCNMRLDETLEGVDAFIEKRSPEWQR
ncbi:MAG: enoyl-CoA hydratase [Gammaproteobacteria bacterium]|nr:enoyl-CoA hydratase [Gammaproteobacteria bacterium]